MVTTGEHHTCALTSTGVPYCWGRNFTTQPTIIPGGLTFTQISAGWKETTCARTQGGAAYCWGDNTYGQLGDGTVRNRDTATAVTGAMTFTMVGYGGGKACGLLADGSVACWGGTNTTGPITFTTAPAAEPGIPTLSVLSVGGTGFKPGVPTPALSWIVCGITAASAPYCWGKLPSPTGVPSLATVSTGLFHACGLTAAGAGYCWGLGTPTSQVSGGLVFKTIAAGGRYTCGLTTDGSAYCWGKNQEGQLGDGTQTDRDPPTPVLTPARFASIAVDANPDNESHTCAITLKGVLYCWGRNLYGQVSGGDPASVLKPRGVRIP